MAGVIILAAAPCTAMVFVWSYLSDGDPAYTLVQVSVNDLIMLVAFAPIVKLLVSGASGLEVPFGGPARTRSWSSSSSLWRWASLSRILCRRAVAAWTWFDARFLRRVPAGDDRGAAGDARR